MYLFDFVNLLHRIACHVQKKHQVWEKRVDAQLCLSLLLLFLLEATCTWPMPQCLRAWPEQQLNSPAGTSDCTVEFPGRDLTLSPNPSK